MLKTLLAAQPANVAVAPLLGYMSCPLVFHTIVTPARLGCDWSVLPGIQSRNVSTPISFGIKSLGVACPCCDETGDSCNVDDASFRTVTMASLGPSMGLLNPSSDVGNRLALTASLPRLARHLIVRSTT